MRLFIAIPLPDSVKDYLMEIEKEFLGFDLRFVKKDHLHLTIDFLGEINENEIETLIRRLSKIHSDNFAMKLSAAGSFPSREKIRVIWIGIVGDERFLKLQKDIRDISGHKDKLMPHLTIARAKNVITDRNLSEKIKGLEIYTKEFEADRFILFESVPTSSGYEHKIIKEFMF